MFDGQPVEVRLDYANGARVWRGIYRTGVRGRGKRHHSGPEHAGDFMLEQAGSSIEFCHNIRNVTLIFGS